MHFNPPPNWPLADDFEPGDGWEPDPAWGSVPYGWPLWIDDAGNSLLPEPTRERGWLGRHAPALAGIIIALALIAAASIYVDRRNAQQDRAVGHQVTYMVTATAAAEPFDCSGGSCVANTDNIADDITYLTAGGEQQASHAALPWSYSARLRALRSGAAIGLTAQRSAGDAGSITCSIQVDGAIVAANTSSGQYAVVACTAPLS